MIIEFLIQTLASFVEFVISLVPDMMSYPQELVDITASLFGFANFAAGLLAFIFGGTAIFTTVSVIFLAYVAFDQIYFIFMWVIKKLPLLNIK